MAQCTSAAVCSVALTGYGAGNLAIQEFGRGQYGRAVIHGMQAIGEAGMTVLTAGEYALAKSAMRGTVAYRGREALIAENRAQSAYLHSKYGGLSSAERMGRLNELAEANAYRRLQELESSVPGAHFMESMALKPLYNLN